MYRIINIDEGVEIGVTEKPRYIKKSKSGQNIEATREEAQGIAYKSTPYNLFGTEGIGVEETVIVVEFDGAEMAADTAGKVAGIEDAMCEQDTATEERLAAIEDALCELDKN